MVRIATAIIVSQHVKKGKIVPLNHVDAHRVSEAHAVQRICYAILCAVQGSSLPPGASGGTDLNLLRNYLGKSLFLEKEAFLRLARKNTYARANKESERPV